MFGLPFLFVLFCLFVPFFRVCGAFIPLFLTCLCSCHLLLLLICCVLLLLCGERDRDREDVCVPFTQPYICLYNVMYLRRFFLLLLFVLFNATRERVCAVVGVFFLFYMCRTKQLYLLLCFHFPFPLVCSPNFPILYTLAHMLACAS